MTTTTTAPLTFFVSGQPISVNHMYGKRRDGTLYLTRAAKAWKDAVGWRLYGAMPNRARPWTHPVISYRFTGVKGDVDNYLKLVNDGIKHTLNCDDRYFSIGTATVERTGESGVWLTIEESEG
ncbi:MAG TPA: RusA family crossover junction endodeoxyribonuclease [Ktedonobacteraceae bacterium]|nr:RusA family crossover junction endodeoxyribonuclease [Ktedonobacteraceae bacterium]